MKEIKRYFGTLIEEADHKAVVETMQKSIDELERNLKEAYNMIVYTGKENGVADMYIAMFMKAKDYLKASN